MRMFIFRFISDIAHCLSLFDFLLPLSLLFYLLMSAIADINIFGRCFFFAAVSSLRVEAIGCDFSTAHV